LSVSTDRLPRWTIVVPFLALGADFALHGRPGGFAGAAIFLALIAAVLAAVHHAEVVAVRIGEPFGAIVLALAVTVIELGLIVSIMLGDHSEPTLMRDTIHATVVLVLHGVAGLCIVCGTLRHREQEFSTQGAQSYLSVLIPMITVTLILPNFTTSVPGPYYTPSQLAFVSVVCFLFWLAFTFVQTIRHREYFLPTSQAHHHNVTKPTTAVTTAALSLLLVALVAVVLLAKGVSPVIKSVVSSMHAPPALVGVIVAAIVLLPEGMTAIRAALNNQLQTSINLTLGSAVASIGLTIPAVSCVAWWTNHPLTLGVDPGGTALLTLSFIMAIITYGTGRATLLSGVVHLILLATWVFLIIVP
jgi:Ca2+:H+ antiporter